MIGEGERAAVVGGWLAIAVGDAGADVGEALTRGADAGGDVIRAVAVGAALGLAAGSDGAAVVGDTSSVAVAALVAVGGGVATAIGGPDGRGFT